MKVHLLQVEVQGPGNTGYRNSVKFYQTEELVKEAIKEHGDHIRSVAETGKIVVQTDKGPRAVMSVMDLFALLGIRNVSVTCTSGEPQGAVVLAGREALIVPG